MHTLVKNCMSVVAIVFDTITQEIVNWRFLRCYLFHDIASVFLLRIVDIAQRTWSTSNFELHMSFVFKGDTRISP